MTDKNSPEEGVKDPKLEEEIEETEETTETEEIIEDPETDNSEVDNTKVPKKESRENAEIRDLREKVKFYQGAAERNFAHQNKPPVEQKLPELDEEIEPGVTARIEKRAQQTEHMQGQLIDKLDELNAQINIPNFKEVQKDVEAHRIQKAQQGQYISRVDSYELLLAKGIVISPTKQPLKIKKSPVKVVNEKTKLVHRGKVEKDFKELTIPEKEQSLEDKVF